MFLLDGCFLAVDGYKIQLREVACPMIYRVLRIPGGAGFLIISSNFLN